MLIFYVGYANCSTYWICSNFLKYYSACNKLFFNNSLFTRLDCQQKSIFLFSETVFYRVSIIGTKEEFS